MFLIGTFWFSDTKELFHGDNLWVKIKTLKRDVMGKMWIPILLVAAWGVQKVGREKYDYYVTAGDNKEIVSILEGYGRAENAYFVEYGKYPQDPSRLGYSVKPGKLSVYFKPEGLPPRFYSVLPETAMPFVNDSSYRLLLAAENKRLNKIEFWIMTEERKPQQLKEFLKLDPLKVD